jgi:hypothetical protein
VLPGDGGMGISGATPQEPPRYKKRARSSSDTRAETRECWEQNRPRFDRRFRTPFLAVENLCR